ncbi:MAG: response regulator transcription factor [Spirochaetales bacterium]|nr:response regulator transcription factor [Spirochaetales bacterium]MCF7939323.1 response regulator transcription factor [Spirochaetales bacterium]
MKILVVDDETSIVTTVQAYFEREGYEVKNALEGRQALSIARTFRPDVVVLDIMLPGIDGLEVLRELRRNADPYIILLTAKTSEDDRIIGLKMGADDYVLKPFSPRELVARVQAIVRRQRKQSENGLEMIHSGEFAIDPAARKAWRQGHELELTRIEFDMLLTLMENSGRVLSRDQLIEQVWGDEYFIEERVVDVHIRRLRNKMKLSEEDRGYITTVRGSGYRFEVEQ